jgi:hypothetical protein
VIRKGAVVVLFTCVGKATIAVRVCEVWIELDCLIEIDDGAVVVLLVVGIYKTAIAVRYRKLWIDVDGLAVISDRAVVVLITGVC